MTGRTNGDIDSDLQKFANQMVNLSNDVKRQSRELETLSQQTRALQQEVAELVNNVPTTDQMTVFNSILEDWKARAWLRKRLKTYFVGGLALLASIWATKGYLSPFFEWLSKTLKP